MKISIVLVKILVISALLIISNGNLALADGEARGVFWNAYYVWLQGAFDKAVYITGYMVKSEWLPNSPGNATAFEEALRIERGER